MFIESDYRRHWIQVNALAKGERWNADVTIRRTLSEDKPHHERVTCFKATLALAEQAGRCGPGGEET